MWTDYKRTRYNTKTTINNVRKKHELHCLSFSTNRVAYFWIIFSLTHSVGTPLGARNSLAIRFGTHSRRGGGHLVRVRAVLGVLVPGRPRGPRQVRGCSRAPCPARRWLGWLARRSEWSAARRGRKTAGAGGHGGRLRAPTARDSLRTW